MPLLLFAPLNSYLAEKSLFFWGFFLEKNESQHSTTNPARQLNKLDFFFFFSPWTLGEPSWKKKNKISHPNGFPECTTNRWGGRGGSRAHLGQKGASWWWSQAILSPPDNISLFWEGGENNCGESALARTRPRAAPRCQRSPTFAIIGSAAPILDRRSNGINLTEGGFFKGPAKFMAGPNLLRWTFIRSQIFKSQWNLFCFSILIY